MEFEWDAAKHARNLDARGIGFDEAALIFEGEVIIWRDERVDYGEVRFNAIGEANGKVLRGRGHGARRDCADHHRVAGKPKGSAAMADTKLTRMTAEQIRAQVARRPPHEAAAARKRYEETTEQDIRRQMRDDGYDPDAAHPADARLSVPVKLVRERLGMTQAELAALLRVPLGTLRNWEQDRFRIDPAAQALLLVLYREPEAALRALRHAA